MDRKLRMQKLDELRNGKQYSEMEIFYKNHLRKLPVYEIDLEFLVYNIHNGRIASMVKSFEKQHRQLDSSDSEDKKRIEGYLWDSNVGRNKQTLEDLKQRGQLKYGIVTRDGIIIDGNRRAFLLTKMYGERNENPGYFKAAILDETLEENPKEIMRLETIYQMGEDEKLGYNAIEKYLKCKELKMNDFSENDIATMMSERKDTIETWLRVMGLMDEYLEGLGYDGIYTRLEETEGMFVDLDRYLQKYEQPSGTRLALWDYQDQDVSDLKLIFYDYIRARLGSDKGYRFIGNPSKKESMFCIKEIWGEFRDEHFNKIDLITKSEKSIDALRAENPDLDLEKLLKHRDEDWKQKVDASLKKNLGQSIRRLDDHKERNAPLELLNRAHRTLVTIDTANESFLNDPAVAEMVGKINSLMYEYKKILKKVH